MEVKRAEPRDSKSQAPGQPGASQWGSRVVPNAANGWAGQPPPTWQQGYGPQGKARRGAWEPARAFCEGGREGALKDRSQRLPCGSLPSRTDHPPGFVLVPYLVSWAPADGEVGLAAHGGCCCEGKGVWPIALCCQAPHAGASLCLSPHVLLGPCLHPKEGPQGGGQWGRQALAPGASSNP